MVGETIIEANGIVLSQLSPVLLDLAVKSSDIILDEFIDNVSGIRDCLALLYGGTVQINDENLETIVKFSIKFEVEKLYKLALEWITANLCIDNTLLFISIGLMAEMMGKVDIKELCLQNIRDNVNKEKSFKTSANWCFADSVAIKFLIQQDILPYSLPVLTAWVQTDANIVLILDDAEVKGITQDLFSQGKRSTDLLNVMSDKGQDLSTSKRIMMLTIKILTPSVASSSASEKSLKDLLTEDYNSYSIEKLRTTENYFSLEHYEFVEVLLPWIKTNRPSQADFIIKLWTVIREQDLAYHYLHWVRSKLLGLYTIPEVTICRDHKFCDKWNQLTAAYLDALCNDRSVTYDVCCRKCNVPLQITVRLSDNTPCYTAVTDNSKHTVKHCYISYHRGISSQFLSSLTICHLYELN